MSEHDKARRSFLINTAVGVGAVAGAALPTESLAQGANVKPAASTNATIKAENRGAFFSEDEAATIAAFAERILPGAPGKPGATDADVINYIDLALAGAYSDQQDFYRRGIAALDAYCVSTFKEVFALLKPAQQDEAVGALESGKATGFVYPTAQAFFNTVRTHTIEGMFADPIYGGNKDFAGWKLVGFPGAQRLYTSADLKSGGEFKRAPITGLQAIDKPATGRN